MWNAIFIAVDANRNRNKNISPINCDYIKLSMSSRVMLPSDAVIAPAVVGWFRCKHMLSSRLTPTSMAMKMAMRINHTAPSSSSSSAASSTSQPPPPPASSFSRRYSIHQPLICCRGGRFFSIREKKVIPMYVIIKRTVKLIVMNTKRHFDAR